MIFHFTIYINSWQFARGGFPYWDEWIINPAINGDRRWPIEVRVWCCRCWDSKDRNSASKRFFRNSFCSWLFQHWRASSVLLKAPDMSGQTKKGAVTVTQGSRSWTVIASHQKTPWVHLRMPSAKTPLTFRAADPNPWRHHHVGPCGTNKTAPHHGTSFSLQLSYNFITNITNCPPTPASAAPTSRVKRWNNPTLMRPERAFEPLKC